MIDGFCLLKGLSRLWYCQLYRISCLPCEPVQCVGARLGSDLNHGCLKLFDSLQDSLGRRQSRESEGGDKVVGHGWA